MSEQQAYNLRRLAAIVLFILQSVVTAAVTQYAADLGLTRFWLAVLGLVNIAIGGALLALPRVQGDGKPRAD